jgi:acyl-CoA synthetase (AMP-forming)/AMP-acid ligase II
MDFIAAFFGCLCGGMIAVPSFPPHPGRRTRALARLESIVGNVSPAAILTTSETLPTIEHLFPAGASAPLILATDRLAPAEIDDGAERWTRPRITADSLAMLQYTSGSTGDPNGVMLSHANLLHNLEQIRVRFEHGPESRGVIWLPPYHDMGLIGGILQPLYAGFPVTLMSPLHFLQQPLRWLEAIARTRGTTSGGPNFAYELCLERVTAEQREGLDLSSWSVAFVGAEPVRPRTLERFADVFGPCGFRREAFYPCFGLAEATLMVTGGLKAEAPICKGGLVSAGTSIGGQEIVIVDPESGRRSPPREVGEIWVRGPSVAQGYWRHPELTERTFKAFLVETSEGPFLRTGDLGYLKDGELFVTGRLKDLIILCGQNHYPQDVEQTIEQSHVAIRSGGCAAFSVDREGTERLVVVVEVVRAFWRSGATAGPQSELPSISQAIRRAVSANHDVWIAEVVLVKPASIPKTPSGKLQRHACRDAFLSGALQERRIEQE